MKIGIIGLGLIGGSLAKALEANTSHTVLATDRDAATIKAALADGSIDGELKDDALPSLDLTIVVLYPRATVEYVKTRRKLFHAGSVVIDCGGVKGYVCDELLPVAKENGFSFIGTHPMAGIEFSGYDHSTSTLFQDASVIITADGGESEANIDLVKELFLNIGFSNIKMSSPGEHDRIIANTSQLAHIVSSAYVKSSVSKNYRGFSAGSFRDMTRVAKLNEEMWTELFSLNRDQLVEEMDDLIDHLREYRDAIASGDNDELKHLLKVGREIKEGLE